MKVTAVPYPALGVLAGNALYFSGYAVDSGRLSHNHLVPENVARLESAPGMDRHSHVSGACRSHSVHPGSYELSLAPVMIVPD